MAVEQVPDVEYGKRLHPVLHLAAPIVTMAAVWGARELINLAYKKVSGRTPPIPNDPQTPWLRALAWTAATTATAACVELTLHRIANERAIKRRARRPLRPADQPDPLPPG